MRARALGKSIWPFGGWRGRGRRKAAAAARKDGAATTILPARDAPGTTILPARDAPGTTALPSKWAAGTTPVPRPAAPRRGLSAEAFRETTLLHALPHDAPETTPAPYVSRRARH